MIRRSVLGLMVGIGVASAVGAGCGYTFDRGDDLLPGDISGRAVRSGRPVAVSFARIAAHGAPTVRRAQKDGSFLVRGLTAGAWLLRLSDDQDGDGIAERLAQRVVSLKRGDGGLNAILLGDVPLSPAVGVKGSVVREDGTPLSPDTVVWVTRSATSLTTQERAGAAADALQDVDLGVEVRTGLKDDATFLLEGVQAGTLLVAAWDPGTGGEGAWISARVEVEAGASNEEARVFDAGVLSLHRVGGARPAHVFLRGAPALKRGEIYEVRITAPGASRAAATLLQTFGDGETDADGFEVRLPLGLWDVYVDSGAGMRAFHGMLPSQVNTSRLPGEPEASQWGVLTLTPRDPCGDGVDGADRDADGLPAMPPRDEAPELWAACVGSCGTEAGSSASAASCRFGGTAFDCDDDNDGQADVREPGCVSLCGGPDFDEDGMCDRADPRVVPCSPNCDVVDAGPDVDAGVGDDGCDVAPAITAATTLGSLVAGHDTVVGCDGSGRADTALRLEVPTALHALRVSLEGSSFDTVLSAFHAGCGVGDVVGCNDDAAGPTSAIELSDVAAGTYFLVVEGYGGVTGDFTVHVSGELPLGAPCDPTSALFVCGVGTCARSIGGGQHCLPARDCADGIDSDDDGVVDEDAAACIAPPGATCPAPLSVPVRNDVALRAGASDEGRVVSTVWSVLQRPDGPAVVPSDATLPEAGLTPLLIGDYVMRFVVTDDDGQQVACMTTVSATTDDQLHIELLWNTEVTIADPTDLDLHLLPPPATHWFKTTDDGTSEDIDCYYGTCRAAGLAWGDSVDNQARLDLDDVDGLGPENINVHRVPDGTYLIGVHYYASDEFPLVPQPVLSIYCGGTGAPPVLVRPPHGAEVPELAVDPGASFWIAAEATFASGDCDVVPLDLVMTRAEAESGPLGAIGG